MGCASRLFSAAEPAALEERGRGVRRNLLLLTAVLSTVVSIRVVAAQNDFVHWESPPVHGADMTPEGGMLLVVNTADARFELFSLGGGLPVHVGAVPVGLDPVSLRARTNTEAWVVNRVSDSASIVDLVARNVIATLNVGDEPFDVVFGGNPQRAFVTVSQLNQVNVYDPLNHAAAPTIVPIAGKNPRALATDGTRVYVAIFESGNRSMILPRTSSAIRAVLGPGPTRLRTAARASTRRSRPAFPRRRRRR